jgi:regulator of protease activity HflC (stomatin/prohibitin superfamily)
MNFASVMQGLTALLWLAFIGLIVLAVVRASRGQRTGAFSTAILVVGILALVLTTVSAGLVFIQPEERGVVISALAPQGYREQSLTPGLRWVIPYFENVIRYPISRQTYTMANVEGEGQVVGDDSVPARTRDGQEIFMDASVIYAIDPEQVVRLHIAWQRRYTDELVRPLARGVIRDAVSQYGVEEVVTSKRLEMAQTIRDALSQKMNENGLVLVDFLLRNITFSPEYAASVEQKQVAEQQAQQAALVVEQRRQEAEQARQVAQGQADAAVIRSEGEAKARVIQAQAEADALELLAAALAQNPDLLTYQYINKIAPGVQVMLVPNDTPYLLPLPTVGPPAPGEEAGSLNPAPTPAAIPSPTPTATP